MVLLPDVLFDRDGCRGGKVFPHVLIAHAYCSRHSRMGFDPAASAFRLPRNACSVTVNGLPKGAATVGTAARGSGA
ncbi:hypothetical protein GCM10020216_083420 [Nonomuraea helvata]